MGYGLYFINQNGIQGISIVTSLSLIYIPIQFLKERKRGGVTAGINCLSRTYLLPGPGLDAECKMVDSPGNVPALMESILVRRDSDITQSLAYSQTLSKPQILIPAEALQINVMVCSQCFFPPRPLFPFHELMGGCRECEHL